MKPTRILLLLVALLAGGLAAYLATRGGSESAPAPAVAETEPVVETQVLVASAPIGVGQRLSAETLSWQLWPEAALRPEYVTIATTPDALTQFVGTVARFEFFPGEPIRSEKLVRSEQGYLSAVLAEGKRGVSIAVSANSGAGGFIVPNDRVDVVLTRGTESGQTSETILQNVKVLAIGKRLGEAGTTGATADAEVPAGQGFEGGTIATLELDPGQGETIINAQTIGQLSLALRSIVDFGKTTTTGQSNNRKQPIRVIRYGREVSISAGTSGQSAPPETVPDTVPPAPVTLVNPPNVSSNIVQPAVPASAQSGGELR